MDALRSPTTRLRRTFNYPTESDDEDAVEEGMDEQDQTTLLTTLSEKDTTSTSLYTKLLLVLPLVPAVFHTPLLLSLSTFPHAVVAISSLLASAYVLYYLPLPPVRINILHLDSKSNASPNPHPKPYPPPSTSKRQRPYVQNEKTNELLGEYIVPVNAVLCGILALTELWKGEEWGKGMAVGGGYLPGLVFVVVMWARRELRPMDLGELERLKLRGQGPSVQ